MIDDTLYRAALAGAGFVDRSSRGTIVVRGADRRSYLHAMLTQDILALEAGRGCYGALLTAQGRMVADMRIYELGEMILLDVAPGLGAAVAERLDQFVFSEDVQLTDETGKWALVRVVGPGAAVAVHSALAAMAGGAGAGPSADALAASQAYRAVLVPTTGGPLVVAYVREWGLPGFDLFVPAPAASPAREALRAAGAVELDDESAEALRIEAGWPEFLVDMTTETIPLEAGIEARAISFTKGCYPGQELIIRVLHRGGGRVAKRLVGLTVDAPSVPERGARLLSGGKDVGRVTSAVWSPALQRIVALGYVQSDLAPPGTLLEIETSDGCAVAVTRALPLVARQ